MFVPAAVCRWQRHMYLPATTRASAARGRRSWALHGTVSIAALGILGAAAIGVRQRAERFHQAHQDATARLGMQFEAQVEHIAIATTSAGGLFAGSNSVELEEWLAFARVLRGNRLLDGASGDRKSTRLNSSH